MTIWFAQNSNVNIDSANMWNDVANGSGNFLTFANLDPADILVANNRTGIAINVDFTCLRITTSNADGGTAGGGFVLQAGRSITCNVVAGTTACLTRTASGAESFIVGNVIGGSSANAFGINNNSASSVSVLGNVNGGSTNSTPGIQNTVSGIVNIVGSVNAGSGGNAGGVWNNSTGTIDITGDVAGVVSAGTGHGVLNNSTGTVIITGSVTGGANVSSNGVSQTSTGIISIGGNVIASIGPGVGGAGAGLVFLNGLKMQSSTDGTQAVVCLRPIIHPTDELEAVYRVNNSGVPGVARSLFTGGVTLGQPVESDVRFGVDYGVSNEYTGTLIVPDPQFVSLGVPTDNTVGTLAGGLDETALHSALDSYANKNDWKAATPANFASLGINSNGDITRVALVDTCTANTDMRGTDNALLASSYTAPLDSTQTQQAAAAAITAAGLGEANQQDVRAV